MGVSSSALSAMLSTPYRLPSDRANLGFKLHWAHKHWVGPEDRGSMGGEIRDGAHIKCMYALTHACTHIHIEVHPLFKVSS